MEYNDLKEATDSYVEKCRLLDASLKKELQALRALKEAERVIHLENFKKVLEGNLSNAMYAAIVKDGTFEENLNWKTATMERKMAQNSERAYHEKLQTIKRQISIN